jgi:arsenate reductase
MQEIGIDIGQQRSKDVAEYLGHVTVWHLIVVCSSAQQSCPTTWPGVMTRQFWDLEDPAAATGTDEERLQKFRQIRDEIDQRIRRWIDSL